MAGIYIHIPFCKQACTYCDFHFSTQLKYVDELVEAIIMEIKMQKHFFNDSKTIISTIYFGGGTPSLLSDSHINKLIVAIEKNFEIANDVEITLEVNPDDINELKVKSLIGTPMNRFSVGVQSFFDEDLKLINRAHNSGQAEDAIKRLQDNQFLNISLDLIYGIPSLTNFKWKQNIAKAIELDVPHISSYCLTVEPKTLLHHQIVKGVIPKLSEEQGAEQFVILMDELVIHGFEHYEISNFAKPNYISKHNSNYWKGVSYLGIGPSAHSFNGEVRFSNVKNNAAYIKDINLGKISSLVENLSKNEKYNELVLTKLRTIWGIDLNQIKIDFGIDYYYHAEKQTNIHVALGNIQRSNDDKEIFFLTHTGKLLADKIASDYFIV